MQNMLLQKCHYTIGAWRETMYILKHSNFSNMSCVTFITLTVSLTGPDMWTFMPPVPVQC